MQTSFLKKLSRAEAVLFLIVSLRVEMRDMSANFRRALSVSKWGRTVYLKREKIALYDCTNNVFLANV